MRLCTCRHEASRTREPKRERQMFLIGYPMCRRFCAWQHLNDAKKDPAEVLRDHVSEMVHLRFMCELYKEHANGGRYFVHEHPAMATSWNEECAMEVLRLEHVKVVVADQFQYPQQTEVGDPVKKPTNFISNSVEIRGVLQGRCRGRGGSCTRRRGGTHTPCTGRTAKAAQVYSLRLCTAILSGCRNQLAKDGRMQLGTVGIQRQDELGDTAPQMMCAKAMGVVIELNAVKGKEEFKDGITRQVLRPDLVKAAGREAMAYFAMKNVWTKVPREEAFQKQGKARITVKWTDVNKGDDDAPNYRSRLVAREVRQSWEQSIFAPTPPLEALRTILSLAATDRPGMTPHVRDPVPHRRTQVFVIDIKKRTSTQSCRKTSPHM